MQTYLEGTPRPEGWDHEEFHAERRTELLSYLSPAKLEKLKRRRAYAREAARVRKHIEDHREEGKKRRGDDVSIAAIERERGIPQGELRRALHPDAFKQGWYNFQHLCRALAFFSMRPVEEEIEEDFIPHRTYGNFAL